jgi:zinc transporter ZupT
MAFSATAPLLSQQLLLNIAEQLKLPLLQIARLSELSKLTGQPMLADMQVTAQSALSLIDNYVLGVQMAADKHTLDVESVSISSVLYDASHDLSRMAKNYGVALELNIGGRFEPVMTNRVGLQSALVSLGSALIEALPALETQQLKLQLATHRCRYGIVAGLYADSEQLSTTVLQQGRKLYGHTRQPLTTLTHSAGAGVFVADAILRAMQLKLQISRHHRLYGLGTVLQPNPQMQLF